MTATISTSGNSVKVSQDGWVSHRGKRIGFVAEVDGIGWYAWDTDGWEPLDGPWPERSEAIKYFEEEQDD